MAFYIKVTKDVADALRLTGIRNRTADGNILLWQADIAAVPGETVFERAEHVGGVALLPQQAKAEIEGTETPVSVTTPEEYKPASEEPSDEEEP
ncbi:hypothetical protein EV202_1438 [Bacteroides heparinolyticus]|uniref:Uncharacterized protein n=1 Tax=Prevotella heparinolytica TaxID=28113 RepID=A0A4V2SE14_9BACE|nr:hypothetical protein [Bacteroides heparinolyticus]TCO86218.1 hypothetical protein EV202_1438 [Bacteroides heparinolyticus]